MNLVVQIDLSDADLAAFDRYEAAVLPLLAAHGGTLERRLRAVGDRAETHLIDFPSRAAFEAYLADPRRIALAPAFAASGATTSFWEARELQGRDQA